jgi:hypothetical protein
MLDKAVADGPAVHPGRSARKLKMHFTEPITFGVFSGFSMVGRSALEVGRSELGLGRCSLLLRTVRSVNTNFVVFMSKAHPSVADGPCTGEFPKSFSYLE